jgi:ABC-type glycerol-3-phosphate transport system substrate-binding protein
VNPAALDGQTINFWHPWSGATAQAIEASVQRFNTENEYGITARPISQGNYDDLYAAVDSAIQSGDQPQLTVGYNYEIRNWAAQGQVVNLDNYVADPQWGLSAAEQADFVPVIWEQDLVEGGRIGFPAQRTAQVMVYNQSWAKEMDYAAPPQTPEEFKEQACAAAQAINLDAEPANNGRGGWAINTAPAAFLTWLYAFDSQVLAPGGDAYQFDTPESEAALSFLKDLYDSGCAWEGSDDNPLPEFASRQALFATLPLSDLPSLADELARAENQDQWAVIGFPAEGAQPLLTVYGPSFALLGASPEEQLASWLLVKWLASPEEQARFITASGTFPLRTSVSDLLKPYGVAHPQWAQAKALLPSASTEPGLASWSVVRWALGDVATQVFRYYFTADRIPATLALLDETAAELHARFP